MKRFPVLLFCIFLFKIGLSQTVQQAKDTVNGETFQYCYIEPLQQPKGLLLLLPGWGEKPKSIFSKTALPNRLLELGYVTIVPQLHQTLYADQFTIAEINKLIRIHNEKYATNQLNIVIGGLSAGGAIAIGYAEYVAATDTNTNLKCVFAIDPPLDLTRMFASAENKIRYNCKNKLIKREGYFIKNYLLNTMDGSPATNPQQYLKCAAYTANATDGGNAKLLNNIPLRLYSEPDLNFVRTQYCSELQPEDINAVDLEGLSKLLLQNGNKHVEYITTTGKGFHSWNILDPVDCADWITRIAVKD